MEDINFYGGNAGLDTLGILAVSTLDKSYLTLKSIVLIGISNFMESKNADI